MKRLFAICILSALPLRAADPNEILARVDRLRNPHQSFTIDVDITNYSGAKTESSKLRVHGKGSDRSVVEFVAPASEKGKYLLMLRDAMWIYMPSTSRPIRISPLQRLMGQASNGDVARTSFAIDYQATSAAEETVNGKRAWILDLVAKDPAVAYNKVRLWVDAASDQPIRADFHVVSGKLIKRAHYRSESVVEIEDLLRAGNRTIMRSSNLVSRVHPDKMFTRDTFGKW